MIIQIQAAEIRVFMKTIMNKSSYKYNIYLYNNWHYGDLIFLMPLYKKLAASSLFNIKVGIHKNAAYLYENFISNSFDLIISNDANEDNKAQDLKELCPPNFLPINTWLGQYPETQSHTWKSTVMMFNHKMFENNIPYILHFDLRTVPMVEFPNMAITVKPNSIYIENGITRSGHSNFMFDLELLAEYFPNINFYCTANPKIQANNFIDCSNKNFIELSNISNKCIAILGKGSGPFLCTYTEDNRYKPRAVCGYNTKSWKKFWIYQNNPLVYINDMEEVINFIKNSLQTVQNRGATNMDKYTTLRKEIERFLKDTTEMTCDSTQRLEISKNLANLINRYVPFTKPNYDKLKLSELRLKGLVNLDELTFDETKINDIINYFKNIPVFAGHVPAQSDRVRRFLNNGARNYSFGSYEIEDTIQCPHLLDLALSPEILSLVEGYLGCTPTIYSINAWWSFPGFMPRVSQDFHRDVDDFKFLALFVYLTDVQGGHHGGQHQFITYTQNEDQVVEFLNGDKELASELFIPKLKDNGYNQAHLYEKHFKDQIKDVTGKAGSIFLADTYALHKGVPPMSNARLVCWIRYGLRENLTYANDETSAVPFSLIKNKIEANEKNEYMLRLITTEQETPAPIYQVETSQGIKDVKLDNYNWQKAKKKYNLQSNNFIKKLLSKITNQFKEPTV